MDRFSTQKSNFHLLFTLQICFCPSIVRASPPMQHTTPTNETTTPRKEDTTKQHPQKKNTPRKKILPLHSLFVDGVFNRCLNLHYLIYIIGEFISFWHPSILCTLFSIFAHLHNFATGQNLCSIPPMQHTKNIE